MKITLDEKMKQIGEEKLRKKLKFYEGRFIRNEETNFDISLISSIKNYVINSEKYSALIFNKVHALKCLAEDLDLQQLFVTLTLPSEYHTHTNKNGRKIRNKKFAYGHLEVYDIGTQMKAPVYNRLIFKYYKKEKRKRWTGKLEEISLNPEHYSIHTGYTKLLDMFKAVRKDRSWTRIKSKSNIFFYTIEPTTYLTAHMHISIWVPKDNIVKIIKTFFRFYPYPLTHIYTQYIPQELSKKEKSGVEESDKDIINYLLKYLNHLKDEDGKVSELAFWYLANKITPFSSSQTTIPQYIYDKLGGSDTLYDATKKYRVSEIYAWSNVLDKKLMKIFTNDKIAWAKKSCKLHKAAHPIGSSNSEKVIQWD